MRSCRTWIVLALGLLGHSGSLVAQEGHGGPAWTIQVDAAIDRLPPIGREATWNKARGDFDHDTAALWMTEYVASGGVLTDEQWKRALLRSRAIRVRESWPVDQPIAVSVEVPAWLPLTEIRLYLVGGTVPVASGRSLFGSCCGAENYRGDRFQVLWPLELGPHTLSFVVAVERGDSRTPSQRRRGEPLSGKPPPGILWTGTLAFQVEVVPTLESMLPAAHGTQLDAEVRELLQLTLDGVFDRLYVTMDQDRAPELANTALSFELTLFESGEECGTEAFVGLVDPGVYLELPSSFGTSRMTVRVRGRPTGVLRNWNATQYWDGELTIPLRDVEWR